MNATEWFPRRAADSLVRGSCTIRAEALHKACNSHARGVQRLCTVSPTALRQINPIAPTNRPGCFGAATDYFSLFKSIFL